MWAQRPWSRSSSTNDDVALAASVRRYAASMTKPSITPQRWTPPPVIAHEPTPIDVVDVIEVGHGPEDVLVDHDGTILTGLDDGRVLRVDPATGLATVLTTLSGRPFGIERHPDGGYVVCSSIGLLRLAADGTHEVLADGFVFCNNAAVANDGTIWFTDSSTKFGTYEWRGDLIEHLPTGRLLRWKDGELTTIVEGLAFANGVALSSDEKTVYVAQTGCYCVDAVDVATGERTTFAPGLPGFPDNISRGEDGLIWVTIASPRDSALDFLLPRAPVLRKLVWNLPEFLQPQPQNTIHVRAYAADGTLVHDLTGTHPRFGMVTGVRQAGDRVWLGSLDSDTIAALRLPSTD
jgi:sugar lactone lactonase YvrE